MRALLALCVVLAGCAANDPHAPKTITAGAAGGDINLQHGQRLRILLAPERGFEWRRVEPRIVAVVVEGAPNAQGFMFTPVRTGNEKLRFEYFALGAEVPKRVVSYDVTVR